MISLISADILPVEKDFTYPLMKQGWITLAYNCFLIEYFNKAVV